MQNDTLFRVKYDGAALASHEMDVKDLAPALLAIGEALEIANKNANGEKVKIQVNLKATDTGCVDVALTVVQGVWDSAVSLFNSSEANAVVNAQTLLGYVFGIGGSSTIGVVGIIKWLRGRKLKNVVRLEDGNFKLEAEGDNEVKVVKQQEITFFSILSIRKRIESIIKPLQREGVESLDFSSQENSVTISKDEIDYFVAPAMEEEVIDEKEYEENLTIVNISFQDDGKWKFFDGSATFFADILDKEFLDKVKKNEQVFAHDDILHVKLKRVQSLADGTIKNSFTILSVLNHRSAAVQIKLPFLGDESNN